MMQKKSTKSLISSQRKFANFFLYAIVIIQFIISSGITYSSINFTKESDEKIHIGSDLELFVDDHIVEKITGEVELYLHNPEPKEVVFVTDKPWEGNTCAYYTFIRDKKANIYRMYYRGSNHGAGHEVTCYAYSRDGINWIRPDLGLIEFDGSKDNNIIFDKGVASHNFTPFIDTNPNCAADAKFKALAGLSERGGLYAFKSSDGIKWTRMKEKPVFPSDGPIYRGKSTPWFDSQNVAFWDSIGGQYVLFYRKWRHDDHVRDIGVSTSSDFINWSKGELLEYLDAPIEHLYTNQIQPYERNTNILMGFPSRYLPLTQQVEPTFMASRSRDGKKFHRWLDALIPLDTPEERDINRSNYIWLGLLQLPDEDREYSVYSSEGFYAGSDTRVRRFTYRIDGFVSVHAPAEGGELITKKLIFSGQKLVLNFVAKKPHFRYGGGCVQVEILDANGTPIEGFALSDCEVLQGDHIEKTVTWGASSGVGALAGKQVQLRFVLKYADLYSFRFM